MILEMLTLGVKDFILLCYLKNMEEVVAKLHLENIENVLSELIFSLGILGETPLSRFPFY
jgi:hypothetical protein